MRITLIVRAGEDPARLEALRTVVTDWRRQGHHVRPRATFEAGDARRFASTARRRSDLIVVAGGDGTLNEVVNGLGREGPRPRLGIIPAGTANDFATGLDIPFDVVDAARVAVEGVPRHVDIARVNRRAFVNVSVGGFGAMVTREASKGSKRWLGPMAYLVSGLRKLAAAEPREGEFVADGEVVFGGTFLFFAVGNGRLTGGGTAITPEADMGDGRLDLVLVKSVPRLELIGMLPEIRAGEHLHHPAVVHLSAETIEVRTEESLAVNVDGEALDGRIFRYRLLRGGVDVMVADPTSAEEAGDLPTED
jgi:diacylglycerol kinase (ATP)